MELSLGVLILSLEFRPGEWDAHQQNVCGVDVHQSVSAGLWRLLEIIVKGC